MSQYSSTTIISMACALALSSTAYAVGPPVQHRFAAGLPALAQQVNANFQELSDRIQSNTDAIAALSAPLQYDFRNYQTADNITSTVLTISGNGLAANGCVTETRSSARTVMGNVTKVDTTRIRTTAGAAVCGHTVLHFESRPDGYYWKGNDGHNNDGTLTTTAVINDPLLIRTSNMQIGKSFGGASPTTTTTAATMAVVNSTIVEKSTLLGVENVTVPYNGVTTYNNCLKIHTDRVSFNGLGGELNQVSWYCGGVGLTKRIDSAGNVWQLSNIILNP